MRRAQSASWCVYMLLAYSVIATAGWARSGANEPSPLPQPIAASDNCERERRVLPVRSLAPIVYARQPAGASAAEATAGASAAPSAETVPSDVVAAEVGHSLIGELYGSADSELDTASLIASLEELQSDPEQLPDDRLEAAFALRRLLSEPPTAVAASELLELVAAQPDAQLALDVLEVTTGALDRRHAEALIGLARSDSSEVRDATMLRLYELLRDPTARGALLPAIEGRSEPLDALAHYVRSEG